MVCAHLFASKRVHIEAFARDLEAKGRSRATIARRLCTVTCFYRYAEQEGLIEHSRRRMCVGHVSTTSLMRSGSTATSSERCSSPPASPAPVIMR